MQNQCVYSIASATLAGCFHWRRSDLLPLWKSGRYNEEFRDIFTDRASRQLTSFSLFHCFMTPHLEVNQLEWFVQCPDFLLPSIYAIILNDDVIHWSCLFPKSAKVMLFGSNSFSVHTGFTPVQPRSAPGDAPKADTSRPPHPLQ